MLCFSYKLLNTFVQNSLILEKRTETLGANIRYLMDIVYKQIYLVIQTQKHSIKNQVKEVNVFSKYFSLTNQIIQFLGDNYHKEIEILFPIIYHYCVFQMRYLVVKQIRKPDVIIQCFSIFWDLFMRNKQQIETSQEIVKTVKIPFQTQFHEVIHVLGDCFSKAAIEAVCQPTRCVVSHQPNRRLAI